LYSYRCAVQGGGFFFSWSYCLGLLVVWLSQGDTIAVHADNIITSLIKEEAASIETNTLPHIQPVFHMSKNDEHFTWDRVTVI